MDTKNEFIENHIIQNTSINHPKDFVVEKLGNERSDFASFKVSALTKEDHEEIKSIWVPHYYARNFREGSKTKRTNGYRVKNPINETPKVSFKSVNRSNRNGKKNRENNEHSRYNTRRVYSQDIYGTPKRSNSRSERMYASSKTPQQSKPMQQTTQPTVQYVYIPYQAPMTQQTIPAQQTFFVRPQEQQQIIQPNQQVYQPMQNLQQPQN